MNTGPAFHTRPRTSDFPSVTKVTFVKTARENGGQWQLGLYDDYATLGCTELGTGNVQHEVANVGVRAEHEHQNGAAA